MSVDLTELQNVVEELAELSTIPKLTPQQNRRFTFLLSQQSLLKAGFSSREIALADLNKRERANGLPLTRFEKETPDEKRENARVWAHFIATGDLLEKRDSTIGHASFVAGTTNGSFVPRTFLAGVQATMKEYDPLFDKDVVRYVETESGNTLQVGYMSDVESVATTVAAQGADLSGHELDPASVGEVDVMAWSYRTPLWRFSLELLNDLTGLTSAIELFETFASDRMARGVGSDLMIGNGSQKPLGLIPSLQILAANAQGAVATGSSETTGGSQTAENSIGVSDLTNLFFSVDARYRARAVWMMNDSTWSSVCRILDKYGRPLVHVLDGRDYLIGKPVLISPSVPSISAGSIPVLFGNFKDFWMTRHATAGDRVQLLKEFPGGIERAECGLRMWSRYDGALLFSSGDAHATCPIKYLVMHS